MGEQLARARTRLAALASDEPPHVLDSETRTMLRLVLADTPSLDGAALWRECYDLLDGLVGDDLANQAVEALFRGPLAPLLGGSDG